MKDEKIEFVEPEPDPEPEIVPLPEGVEEFEIFLTSGLKIGDHFLEHGKKVGEVHAMFGIDPGLLCASVGRKVRVEPKASE